MRLILTAAALAIALPAAAQTAGGGSGASAPGGVGVTKGAATSAPAAGSRLGLARMATSHAQTAGRLSQRGTETQAAKDPKVAQASEAANAAVVEDPTVQQMMDAAMAQPPSLAGGPPPSPNGINPP